MKIWPAFAMVLALGVIPARAQQQANEPEKSISQDGEIELLELEQEVDKTLLREALLLLGRARMRPLQEQGKVEEFREREAEAVAALKEYIEQKKHTFTRRSDELKKRRAELAKTQTSRVYSKEIGPDQ
jgi:hypothetical protein